MGSSRSCLMGRELELDTVIVPRLLRDLPVDKAVRLAPRAGYAERWALQNDFDDEAGFTKESYWRYAQHCRAQ